MPACDDQGYLLDPADWSEDLARVLARQENIELGEQHWLAIRYMREYFAEHQVIPDVRFVTRHLAASIGGSRNLVFELFPYGYVKQACKIAGMRKPRSWSTG
ncbi:MAG: TusE/DsrC/DsvC family sulfur relay protein [Sterolibacteriaceae bacterium]|nr:TusE/DsrC/DsvC family sulfur relay protein [Sterolibacteriaceae bacterium]